MIDRAAGGVLPVDKPAGPTSHDLVARARAALDSRKIGHTGTLDPFASGLLLLCVGAATRLAEYLTSLEKTYVAVARLGEGTDTLDPEGRVVERTETWSGLDAARIRDALARFRGRTEQVPPQFSAKKVGGEAMYARARRGERVELAPVPVEIHEAELLEADLPRVRFRIRCSSGTYVRALARDLGEALGEPAHLVELRRTGIGPFRVDDAVAADELEDPGAVAAAWIEPARALSHLPAVELTEDEARRVAHGQAIRRDDGAPPGPGTVALLVEGRLAAVAESGEGTLRPRKVFLRV